MTRVAITGYLSIDSLVHDAITVPPRPGGAALYAALGAAQSGASVSLHASVGPDWDESWSDAIRRAGIKTDGLSITSQPTRRTQLIYGNTPRQSPHYDDPKWLAATQAHTPNITAADCDVIVATPMPVTALAQIIARAQGRLVIADTSEWAAQKYKTALLDLIPHMRAFAPSREETRLLFPALSDDDALRALAASGTIIVQKRGAEGVVIAWDKAFHPLPAPPVTVVDPTGAGDAFVGAFAAGLAQGRDPVASATFAQTISARAVSAMGAAGLGLTCALTRKDLA